ncbi:MAG: hypothetical protein ABFC30_08250, partial [Proteiniphilum sp.]
CEPNDAKDYIAKIRILLKDPALRESMKHQGNKYISLLSWEHLAEVYFSDMEQLAHQSPVQPTVTQSPVAFALDK